MIEILGDLVKTLVLIALISLIIDMLIPGDEYRRYVRMVIGFIILLTIVSAVTEFTRRGRVDIFAVTDIPAYQADNGFLTDEGRSLTELNRQQVIREYKRMVRDYLTAEIGGDGNWELVGIELEFEDEPPRHDSGWPADAEAYYLAGLGELKIIKAFVKHNETPLSSEERQDNDHISAAVTEVAPVTIIIGEPADEGDINGDEETAPPGDPNYDDQKRKTEFLMEQIAALLQVSTEKVIVEIER